MITTNSLGRRIAKTDEQIRAFWRWFGDSKVVDAQGRPLVVYHGTSQPFKEFKKSRLGLNTKSHSALAFFFTDSITEAGEYADLSARNQFSNAAALEKKQEQMQAKIAAAERRGDWSTAERLMEELEALVYGELHAEPSDQQILPVYLKILRPAILDMGHSIDLRLARVIKQAKKTGIDGVVLTNVFDPVGPSGQSTNQWAVFSSTQIKSAIGNRGAFDPEDPVITNPHRNPRLGNTGLEFKQAMALSMLRQAIDMEGGNTDAAESIAEGAFQLALHRYQDMESRILPVKDYPQLRLAATLHAARMIASGEVRRNPQPAAKGSSAEAQAVRLFIEAGLRLGRRSHVTFVEQDAAGRVLGAVAHSVWPEAEPHEAHVMFDLVVDPAARGRALGSQLVDAAVGWWRSQRAAFKREFGKPAVLVVHAINPKVTRMLERRGARVVMTTTDGTDILRMER